MKDFITSTLSISSGLWCSLGFYYRDMGMLIIGCIFMLSTILFLTGRYAYKRWVLSKLPKFVAISYGDEWFLRDERGVMHQSYRKEVSDLMLTGQITKFE